MYHGHQDLEDLDDSTDEETAWDTDLAPAGWLEDEQQNLGNAVLDDQCSLDSHFSNEDSSAPPKDNYDYLFEDCSSPSRSISPAIEGESSTEDPTNFFVEVERQINIADAYEMGRDAIMSGSNAESHDRINTLQFEPMDQTPGARRAGTASTETAMELNQGHKFMNRRSTRSWVDRRQDGHESVTEMFPKDSGSYSMIGTDVGLEEVNKKLSPIEQVRAMLPHPLKTIMNRQDRRKSRDPTPTESELADSDFQFDKVIKSIKSKHTQQALHGVDPSLSRQQLYRIARAARDFDVEEAEDIANPDIDQDHITATSRSPELDINELEDASGSDFEDDTSPCEDLSTNKKRHNSSVKIVGKAQPCKLKSQLHQMLEPEDVPIDEMHMTLIQSKPYLTEITPNEAQGQHPSIIPRSPQRGASTSRASSLASETRPSLPDDDLKYQPLTEDALAVQNGTGVASRDWDTSFKRPSQSRQHSPFRLPAEIGSSMPTINSSPLRRLNDTLDAASTQAIMGSPAPYPPIAHPRPDTPRPSITAETAWLCHLTPSQTRRSACPSPNSQNDVSMLDTSMPDSPTPVMVSIDLGKNKLQTLPRFETCVVSEAQTDSPITRQPETLFDILKRDKAAYTAHPQTTHGLSDRPDRTRPSHELEREDLPPNGQARRQPSPIIISTTSQPLFNKNHKPYASEEPQKRASDPFLNNSDMIPFPDFSSTSPLTPLTDIAGQIYQNKRGQRKTAIPANNAKRNTVSRRAVSSKSLIKAVMPVQAAGKSTTKRSKSTGLGVHGVGAKVFKQRSTSRKVSNRKAKKQQAEDIPRVPSLPVEMEVDQSGAKDALGHSSLPLPLPELKDTSIAATNSPSKRNVTPRPRGKKQKLPIEIFDKPEPSILSKTTAHKEHTKDLTESVVVNYGEANVRGRKGGTEKHNASRGKKQISEEEAEVRRHGKSSNKKRQNEGLTSAYSHKGDKRPEIHSMLGSTCTLTAMDYSENNTVPTEQDYSPATWKNTKKQPTKARPRPSPWQEDGKPEGQGLKTPSREPGKKAMDDSLTPESAEGKGSKAVLTPVRRSPRLVAMEKNKA